MLHKNCVVKTEEHNLLALNIDPGRGIPTEAAGLFPFGILSGTEPAEIDTTSVKEYTTVQTPFGKRSSTAFLNSSNTKLPPVV